MSSDHKGGAVGIIARRDAAEVEAADSVECQEQQKELGEYLANAARWEIGRSTGISTAVTGAFSLIGTGASVVAAIGTKQLGGLNAVTAVSLGAFGMAANLMFAALLLILSTLRSTRTRFHPRRNLTGWPLLTNPDRGDRIRRFRHAAAELAVTYREDATTLARIASAKHGKLRLATFFAMAGTVAFAIGVDAQLVSMLLAR
ncbi:hypothetical protein MOQ72_37340 [Saccharopolyspora sp. K220]|uniref:hypothetical protein n=1 Tax=Saccharopolyspora soli TaxID=2926618 RepID=UPI001F58CDD2|nr:hypothetical protein [Saccharopolyspora soli]MCI2423098.1 hypothetical protein [Saccharopolyspora soli]